MLVYQGVSLHTGHPPGMETGESRKVAALTERGIGERSEACSFTTRSVAPFMGVSWQGIFLGVGGLKMIWEMIEG